MNKISNIMILATAFVVLMLLFGLNAVIKIKQTDNMSAPLTNFLFYKEKIYIGGADRIYEFDEYLNIIQTTSTSENSSYEEPRNINKILLAHHSENGDILVVCGTGNLGICEVRNLSNIEYVVGHSSNIDLADNYLKVSSNVNRPAFAMVTQVGNIVIAVTFGEGIQTMKDDFIRSSTSFKYAISTRNLPYFQVVENIIDKQRLRLKIQKVPIEDYVIYYKTGFQHNWMSYFITNQKSYVGSNNYVSKLVRICQNDTGYTSYADIVLVCERNDIKYNLIQDVIVVEIQRNLNSSEKIFVGAFTRGNDPEHPSGDSVICVTGLNTLNDAIVDGVKEYAASFCTLDENDPYRYLPTYRKNQECLRKDDFIHFDFDCNSHTNIYSNVIIENPIIMESKFHLSAEAGTIKTLCGGTYEHKLAVLFGTSTGNIVQTTMLQNFSLIDYNKKTIDAGHEIRKIFMKGEDAVYIMTSNRVLKYPTTNCSEFVSCADVIKRRNPLCGWCVYKQRATRRADCSWRLNHWVWSFKECLTLSVDPITMPVAAIPSNVTLNMSNIPIKYEGDIYQCRFAAAFYRSITDAVEIEMTRFVCQLPDKLGHGYLDIELLVRTNSSDSAVLSKTSLLLYDCRQFNSCLECINATWVRCNWCANTVACQELNTICKEPISEESFCPQLSSDKRTYIPAGIRTIVTFKITNIVDIQGVIYKCLLLHTSVNVIATRNGELISCSVPVMETGNTSEREYKIVITYGQGSDQKARVDDNFQHKVTVYSCGHLATDCSHCLVLNKTRYFCIWNELGGCVYSWIKGGKPQCPAPSITKILPQSGSIRGGTRLTIYGINLGTSLTEVDNITVAGVPCDLIIDSKYYQIYYGPIYETNVLEWIVCLTKAALKEVTGVVTVVRDWNSSENYIEFSYKVPKVTSVYPNYGPIDGGTRITIRGNNLGVGNRNIYVLLGDQPCQEPMLYPSKILDSYEYVI